MDRKFFLSEDFKPKTLIGRERYIDDIERNIRGEKDQKLLYAFPGLGKTTQFELVRSRFEDDRQYNVILLNCKDHTPKTIYFTIFKHMGAKPSRGLAVEEYHQQLVELLKKEKRTTVLIFDEFQELARPDYNVFRKLGYSFARMRSIYGLKNLVVFFITNKDEARTELLKEAGEGYVHEAIFPQYSEEEVQTIIEYYMNSAFTQEERKIDVPTFSRHVFLELQSNIRDAKNILHHATRIAEMEGKNPFEICDRHIAIARELRELNRLERVMYSLQHPHYLIVLRTLIENYMGGLNTEQKDLHEQLAWLTEEYAKHHHEIESKLPARYQVSESTLIKNINIGLNHLTAQGVTTFEFDSKYRTGRIFLDVEKCSDLRAVIEKIDQYLYAKFQIQVPAELSCVRTSAKDLTGWTTK